MYDPLTVYVVHNQYQQSGGEDRVFEQESELLDRAGHRVLRYVVHNDSIREMPRAQVALRTVWSRGSYRELTAAFQTQKPDVVHVHNTLPLISPAVFVAARRAGAAVVNTLHNYRMVCPSATLFRSGGPCNLCVKRPFAFPGVRHACYRSSRTATAAVATSTYLHKTLGTYANNVDRFITLTEFANSKLIEGGFPPWQLAVKPNFTYQPNDVRGKPSSAALFVGRLSAEKGVLRLLDAWARHDDLPELRIVGDGPLLAAVEAAASRDPRVTVLGELPSGAAREEMLAAAMLVFPSIWYEGFPMTIVEALSVGLPVVASRIGSVAEIVPDEEVGLTFAPNDVDGLAACVRRLITDRQLNASLGNGARLRYLERYTPERNLEQLLRVYEDALAHRNRITRR